MQPQIHLIEGKRIIIVGSPCQTKKQLQLREAEWIIALEFNLHSRVSIQHRIKKVLAVRFRLCSARLPVNSNINIKAMASLEELAAVESKLIAELLKEYRNEEYIKSLQRTRELLKRPFPGLCTDLLFLGRPRYSLCWGAHAEVQLEGH